jgi:hypothetical protein
MKALSEQLVSGRRSETATPRIRNMSSTHSASVHATRLSALQGAFLFVEFVKLIYN